MNNYEAFKILAGQAGCGDRDRSTWKGDRMNSRQKEVSKTSRGKLIRERDYEAIKNMMDVVYWRRCNGFD